MKIVDVYKSALRLHPELVKYFPDYSEDEMEYRPQKDYFWNVYYSKEPESALHMLERLKSRNAQGKLKEEDAIEIRQDIFDMIQESSWVSSKSPSNQQVAKAELSTC